MKHSSHSSLSALALMLGTLTLVGCGGALNIPDSVVSSQASGPAVNGTVYGGHAPITGAHVYLLQPGISAYGGLATSLLGNNGATSANGYTLHANVNDPNVPTTGTMPQYVLSDSNGGFSFTGAYTCQVGQPVYVYAYGGNIGPVAASTITETINISTATVAGGAGAYTYTFNFTAAGSPATPLAVGDTVALTLTDTDTGNNQGTNWEGLTSVTVATVNSTTNPTQFTAKGALHTRNGGTGSGTYTYTTLATPATNNNSIVQLATLGNCPSSGNFSTAGNGAISFVYLNEVSTVATAYTFQPFTLSTNNDAWHIGSSGTTQALLGIANAADTAAQLYNIQGSTQLSTTSDGEGHLANSTTQAGNGIVPQATIDSLADILANCVDSVPATVGTPTTQCSSLFNIATDNGETGGTAPVDTGTAAINIARFPAGNNSSTAVDTTYAKDIFALQGGGTVPYTPDLTAAPNDWTIAINYPYTAVAAYPFVSNGTLGRAESVEVDALGQIWITAQTNTDIVRWSPLGTQNATPNDLGYIPGYVSIDGGNNAWTGNADSTSGIFEAGANGIFTTTYGSGYNTAYVNIADKAGDDFFFAKTGGTGTNYEMFEYPAGSTTSTTPTQINISPSVITTGDDIAHGAIDASGDFWLTTETSNQISRITAAGTSVFAFATPNAGGGTANRNQPEFPAIDHNGTAWIPIQSTAGQIYKVTSTGTTTILTAGTTGGELSSTFGSAVDGNGNVWITNRSGNYGSNSGVAGTNTILTINGSGAITGGTSGTQVGAGTVGTINTAISPPTNYVPTALYPGTGGGAPTLMKLLNDSLNVAVDPSGNVWITNYLGNAVVQLVGAAAPVVTPLSVAAGNNMLGQKP
jgi:hypothetical protein